MAVALPSPSAAARVAPGGLVGVWQWQSTQPASGAAIVAADPTRYTITFQPDGVVQAKADCNQVGGPTRRAAPSLKITLGPSTLVACPPDSQADQFLDGLNQAATYAITGGNLELGLSGGGRMILTPSTPLQLVGQCGS